ncbi:hypothetical protein SmaMPs15_000065 [Stenotrophomonas maltophilia phage vB_SmaM_Ps15]|uniref:Uncharacterized protein n=1 Tax=Stenotrophomonas maltophilia phage vB_SmaM_Ps15 TaxID=3071007 RepID=A0AAE9FMK0_9CAUD|nr:hypothetical protein PQC01_gp065 [Stenotrophomonas maltophilia phage vB_SmaM_Ps15]UMO77216.1 hypothetical protein SmaMPs15_000065 [Stenotrophomonas maltophilia phage vB_SmaM_Ps15]
MYPFYETLEYPHQFKEARRNAEKGIEPDMRRTRRQMRRRLKDGFFIHYHIKKPGKFISRNFTSSNRFRYAYAEVRAEAEYYSMAEW